MANDHNELPLKRRSVFYVEEKPVKCDATTLTFLLGT